MKKIIIVILIVILSVGCLVACSTQNTDTDVEPTTVKNENAGTVLMEKASSPLVGCWVYNENNEKFVMHFFPDGKLVTATYSYRYGCWENMSCIEYCTDANVLLIERATTSNIAEYLVNGDKLTLTNVDAYGKDTSKTFTKWEKGMVDYLSTSQGEEKLPTATNAPSTTKDPTATKNPNVLEPTPTRTPIVLAPTVPPQDVLAPGFW